MSGMKRRDLRETQSGLLVPPEDVPPFRRPDLSRKPHRPDGPDNWPIVMAFGVTFGPVIVALVWLAVAQ